MPRILFSSFPAIRSHPSVARQVRFGQPIYDPLPLPSAGLPTVPPVRYREECEKLSEKSDRQIILPARLAMETTGFGFNMHLIVILAFLYCECEQQASLYNRWSIRMYRYIDTYIHILSITVLLIHIVTYVAALSYMTPVQPCPLVIVTIVDNKLRRGPNGRID